MEYRQSGVEVGSGAVATSSTSTSVTSQRTSRLQQQQVCVYYGSPPPPPPETCPVSGSDNWILTLLPWSSCHDTTSTSFRKKSSGNLVSCQVINTKSNIFILGLILGLISV